MKSPLTLPDLKHHIGLFIQTIHKQPVPALFGTTDGKAIGTYTEHALHDYLQTRFDYQPGSSASGIDFPEFQLDLKVTSTRQPQSSCPFRSADQKVYGLGYHLIVLVYDKYDDAPLQAAYLDFQHSIFIDQAHTADYQTTRGLLDILARDANADDIIAFLEDRNLPLDEVGRQMLAERILQHPPQPGFLTISNALQWRLQYSRAITLAEAAQTPGVETLR